MTWALAVVGLTSVALGMYTFVHDTLPRLRDAHRFYQESRLKWDGFQPPFLIVLDLLDWGRESVLSFQDPRRRADGGIPAIRVRLMKDGPRWYRRGAIISADEVGTFTTRCQQSGWYLVENHYGHITISQFPTSFWGGLRAFGFWSGLRSAAGLGQP